MPIKLLDKATIARIAAGEVIERPSSVVKELLENSLDAGAKRVDIVIREGGIGCIEVSDDGCGIVFSEVLLAFERHATSKLSSFEDIYAISSLGFRGEAL
ncbi:MAG: ATP-binding protein, partial [Dehalococcoides mccartyi]